MRPQTVVERLDFVAKRINGLKFTPPTQLKPGDDPSYGCFMSCDMYYIEIKVDQSHQTVKDVIISHGNNAEGISCPVLRKVLQDQDFETFAKHLSGLHSIYQINASDKRQKQKAYLALTALETDLTILYDHQRRRINNCHDIVHKSPLGIMEPRKGGLPVKLTYFITAYDLVDVTQRGHINPTINNIIDKNLGLSATVEIEGSNQHKLQIKSLISTSQNSSLPVYAPLIQNQNSEKLPAQFVLKLSQPLPMLNTSIDQIINEINEPATIKEYLTSLITNSKESLINLIVRQELDLNKGPFCRSVDILKGADSDSCDLQNHVYSVKLLDQHHSYHILDHYLERQEGLYITKIPFTHPTSIPNILRVLRQQAMFNFVIGSCIRRNKNNINNNYDENTSKNSQDMNIFDIIPVNLNNICISFEHPSKESLATLEIDLRELSCQLYALDKESVCSNEFATKVLQKCWSIPVTLRSVLKKCNERRLALLEDANKRRELELQELLTKNSAQQGLQYKSHLQYQETLQSKFNSLNDKTNSHDLNSVMTEFSAPKMNYASTSDTSNQTYNSNSDSASNRSSLLRKFSCKPKAKQTTATKNQTGNKTILSLMLKRPNSTTSSTDDANLKATMIKKVKTKILMGESSIRSSGSGITTTKLISPEVATAARLANKQTKQAPANQTSIPVSLIRSPTKTQPITMSSNQSSPISLSVNLNSQQVVASSSKQFESPLSSSSNPSSSSSSRIKSSQPNGSNNNTKPRKSSIVSVIDKLVGDVNTVDSSQSASTSDNNSSESANKNIDSSKGSPLGAKSKNRVTSDQFAIKQGSVGSLKLTVTKTKPITGSISSSTASTSSSSSTTTPMATSTTTTSLSSSTTTTLSSASATSSTTSSFLTTNNPASAPATVSSTPTSSLTNNNSSITAKSESTNKILGISSSTPNIKYTIPKISKTQSTNSTETQNPTSNTESNTTNQGDDSSNPTSSANVSNAASSTTTGIKRTTPTPFNRTNNSNRNPVSGSTHPLNRTTSNPLANNSRPSSTSTSENHTLNRISSSNQNQQQNMRQQQQQMNFRLNPGVQQQLQSQLQQQQQQPLQPQQQQMLLQQQQQQLQQQQQPLQRMINPNMNMAQFVSDLRASTSVINAPPQFYIRQPMFDDTYATVSTTPRLMNNNEVSQSLASDRKAIDSSSGIQPIIIPGAGSMSFQQPKINITSNFNTAATTTTTTGNLNNMLNNEMPSTSLTTNAAAVAVNASTTINSGNQGVSSSSDLSCKANFEPTISTPSSPTECSQVEIVKPPPLIPIDSLDEPQIASPETDHPDDASDRLSIVDMNENIADINSVAGTPKPSSANSPMNSHEPNSATPSSSSQKLDPPSVITSGSVKITETEPASTVVEVDPPKPVQISPQSDELCPSSKPSNAILTTTTTNSTDEATMVTLPTPQSSIALTKDESSNNVPQNSSTLELSGGDQSLAPQSSSLAASTSDLN